MCWQRTKQAKKKKSTERQKVLQRSQHREKNLFWCMWASEWTSERARAKESLHLFSTFDELPFRVLFISTLRSCCRCCWFFFYQPDFISVWDVLNLWRVSDTRSRALWFSFRFDVLLILVIHFISVIAKIKWIEEEEEEERRMKNIKKNHIRQINKDNRLIETRRTQNDDDVKPKTGEAKTKCITCTHTSGHGWEQSLNCEIRQKLTMNKKKNALNVDVET